ncbi:hypothetical protein R3P38DRAFT_2690553, partial [Favolaschia claudopus]
MLHPASTTPSPPRRQTPSDVFRPRLPLDPFGPAETPGTHAVTDDIDPDAPWLAHDLPVLANSFSKYPAVILVLGAPTPHVLSPLLRSPTFAHSLILLVTHSPPPLSALINAIGRPAYSTGAHPALRILRLRAPLVPGAPTFALSLVSILDAAAAVARSWRASAVVDAPILQLAQNPADDDPAFSVPQPLTSDLLPTPVLTPNQSSSSNGSGLGPARRRSRLGPPEPRPPSVSLSAKRASSSSLALSFKSNTRSRRGSVSSAFSTGSTKKLREVHDNSRPFDALVSFLPAAQQEKAILKQVVLVSTLAGGFLSGPAYFGSRSSTYSTYNFNNSSNDGYDPYSRPGSGASTPHSYSEQSGAHFDWSSAPGSPTAQTHGFSSRPGTPGSINSNSAGKRRFSIFGGGNATSKSRSQPASLRGVDNGDGNDNTIRRRLRVRAHIVHVLPASYRSPRLVGALSAFLGSIGAGG